MMWTHMFPYCVRRTQIQLNCTAPLYSILMNVALVTTTRYYAPDTNTTSGHIRGGGDNGMCRNTFVYTHSIEIWCRIANNAIMYATYTIRVPFIAYVVYNSGWCVLHIALSTCCKHTQSIRLAMVLLTGV